jgi:hypothetical protein
MDLGVAVDFARRRLQNLGPAPLRHAQHVDRADHAGFHRLDRVVLIVARRGGAGEIVNLVDFERDRMRDVMPHELEVGLAEQMVDVRLLAGEEVVEANHIMPLADEPLTNMRPQKPGAPGHQNTFYLRHEIRPFVARSTPNCVLYYGSNSKELPFTDFPQEVGLK